MKPKLIYMDYAAATPLDATVAAAMQPFESDEFANPSALYDAARAPRLALDEARRRVAAVLGAKPSEIVMTAGATESINLAIQGVLRGYPGAGVVTSGVEHAAVLATVRALAGDGYSLQVVAPVADRAVRASDLAAAVTDRTVLVSLAYASSETGVIQPLGAVGKLLSTIRADRLSRGVALPLYLHSDATAVAGWLGLPVDRLAVDLLTLNGGKLHGPKSSGCLYVRTGTHLRPLIYGGGQESGRRSGTPNAAAAVGLARALELAEELRPAETRRLRSLRLTMEEQLLAIPGAHLVGSGADRLPHISCLWFGGVNGEDMVLHLDREGIAAGTGAACAVGSRRPSEALLAMGLSPEHAQSSLRLSLGRGTTAADIERVTAVLPRVVARLQEHGVQ